MVAQPWVTRQQRLTFQPLAPLETRILIQLTRAEVECLVRHIQPESGLKKKLGITETTTTAGLPIESSNPLNCSEAEAYELLRVANERCAAAVQKIKEGIILSNT